MWSLSMQIDLNPITNLTTIMHRSSTLSLHDKIEPLRYQSGSASLCCSSSLPATEALNEMVRSSKRRKKAAEDTPRSSLMSLVEANSARFDMTDLFNAAQNEANFEFPAIDWRFDDDDDHRETEKKSNKQDDLDPDPCGSTLRGEAWRRAKSTPCFSGKRTLIGLVRSKTLCSEVDRLVDCTNWITRSEERIPLQGGQEMPATRVSSTK